MNLLKRVPGYVLNVLDALEQNNHKSYLVGGAVRDLLLCKQPKDYDITTSALPEQVKSIFSHVVLTGEKHGTVTIVTGGGDVEVTTMRKDGVYKDNRHPESVKFTDNIVKDLSRRDFTINAMAYNNKLIDPFGGAKALRAGEIIAVNNPDERFQEDALRMIRAIRFASQLCFIINAETFDAIKRNKDLICNISAERIRDELCKIIISDCPSMGIKLLHTSGLLEIILPEISNMVGFDQCNPYHNKNVFDHTLLVMENTSNDLISRLAALLHDVGKPKTFSLDEDEVGHFYKHHMVGADMTKDILHRLRFDTKTIDTVCLLVKEHMIREVPNVKRFINRVSVENLDKLFELQIADIRACAPPHDISHILNTQKEVEKILTEKQPLTVKDLKIDGYDLIAMGMQPGKQMGKMLNDLLELVLDNPKLNERNTLLKYVRREK